MSRFLLSPAAQADIAAIWEYSARRWGENRADAYVLAIRDACQDLAAGTKLSRSANDVRPGYRKSVIGSHVLFIRAAEKGTIDIVRILHVRMDPTRHIDNPQT